MKIITIWNLKGGTGKTTTTFNLAANLAKDNKMLLLDLDMQANLTSFFDIDTKKYKTNKPDISALLADDSLNISKVYIIQELIISIISKVLMML